MGHSNMINAEIYIIDTILGTYRDDLGSSFDQYHNHVYRIYHFAVININSEIDIRNLAIAAAFHDIGIWTGNTFDYLAPSIALARKYCTDKEIDSTSRAEIEITINEHHRLSVIKTSELAEVFRQADLVDLSWGLIRLGRKSNYIKLMKKKFPNKGFHYNLLKFFLKNLIRHPLKPLPMYKW